jgi:putative SOS response-associated peptidase YedK
MCVRFTRYSPVDVFAEMVSVGAEFGLNPRYNILPGQTLLLCRNGESGRELVTLKWGLIPPWEPEPKTKLSTINAKAETVATSRLYRYPFRKQRCLIAADGFYEPKATGEKRKPQYYFHRKDGHPFFFAGLWGRWRDAAQVIDSCTLITTDANTTVGQVHARMPVILPREMYDLWLDPTLEDPEALQPLLKPAPGAEWEGYPVGYYTRDDRPELIERQ